MLPNHSNLRHQAGFATTAIRFPILAALNMGPSISIIFQTSLFSSVIPIYEQHSTYDNLRVSEPRATKYGCQIPAGHFMFWLQARVPISFRFSCHSKSLSYSTRVVSNSTSSSHQVQYANPPFFITTFCRHRNVQQLYASIRFSSSSCYTRDSSSTSSQTRSFSITIVHSSPNLDRRLKTIFQLSKSFFFPS